MPISGSNCDKQHYVFGRYTGISFPKCSRFSWITRPRTLRRAGRSAAELIAGIPTIQAFTDNEVVEEDVDKILSAGINAPSAMNGQNWHFTAVTDADVLQQIADGMGGGRPAVSTTDGQSAGSHEVASPVDETSDEQTGGRAIESSALPAGGSDGKAKAGITDAPLAIVVSCKEGSEFDAGLTCQKYVGGGTAIEIWYKDYFITHDRTQRRKSRNIP